MLSEFSLEYRTMYDKVEEAQRKREAMAKRRKTRGLMINQVWRHVEDV